mmetsp:Transcript_28288/g.59935  ORF Transcript_28288/g.59935 Transcript_28288/m.59935 type:complete len:212 (+) Transcript_28288:714-1349(+)
MPTVAAAIFGPKPRTDLHGLLRLLVAREGDTVLGPHQILCGAGLLHPLQGHASQGLGLVLTAIRQDALIRDLTHLPDIPEKEPTIGGHRGALGACLALEPDYVIYRIVMGHLHSRLCQRSRSLPQVVIVEQATVAPTDEEVTVLLVVLATDQWRRCSQFRDRAIALTDVPDVRRHRHLVGHALEPKVRVRTHYLRRPLGVPTDLRDTPLLV